MTPLALHFHTPIGWKAYRRQGAHFIFYWLHIHDNCQGQIQAVLSHKVLSQVDHHQFSYWSGEKRICLQSLSKQTWPELSHSDNSGISGICETHGLAASCYSPLITCVTPVSSGQPQRLCTIFQSMIKRAESRTIRCATQAGEDKADSHRNTDHVIWRLHVPSLSQRSKWNVLINYYQLQCHLSWTPHGRIPMFSANQRWKISFLNPIGTLILIVDTF